MWWVSASASTTLSDRSEQGVLVQPCPPPSRISHSYPGSDLSVEQLVHALIQVLNPGFLLRREFLGLEPQKIYGIEHELSKVLQGIRTTKNTFVPVNRLPPEILSRVFECRTRERDLVAATQVCRHWRYTLVSSPSLWTCFQFQLGHDLDRTLTYLERSESAPIGVRIVGNYWKGNLDVLEYLAPHIARTRSLAIQTPLTHNAHTVSLLFCDPAPLLQHLEFCNTSEVVGHIPDNFLGQRAPSLRSVNFVHICPTFESIFPLPNLTEFHLSLGPATPFRVGGRISKSTSPA